MSESGGRFDPTVRRTALFVLSAAAAALALRLAWVYPVAAAFGLAGALLGLLLHRVSRRRSAALLRSGDVRLVLARWQRAMPRVPHAETMVPLMTATALAAYGWNERARAVLRTARRGPAWDAAVEHRLFLDVLLLTFEGQTHQAIGRARDLEALPLPSVATPWLAHRVRTLRRAVGALARAFGHVAERGDGRLLKRAGDSSPLVYWAMRYAAAVLAVDRQELERARRLLADAPAWPEESCFGAFHDEIVAEVQRRAEQAAP
jgi:hypothetical protein